MVTSDVVTEEWGSKVDEATLRAIEQAFHIDQVLALEAVCCCVDPKRALTSTVGWGPSPMSANAAR